MSQPAAIDKWFNTDVLRVWFGALDTNPTSGTYGRLNGQANNPRNIQLGLKLTY